MQNLIFFFLEAPKLCLNTLFEIYKILFFFFFDSFVRVVTAAIKVTIFSLPVILGAFSRQPCCKTSEGNSQKPSFDCCVLYLFELSELILGINKECLSSIKENPHEPGELPQSISVQSFVLMWHGALAVRCGL